MSLKTHQLHVRVSEELWERVKIVASYIQREPSDLVRDGLQELVCKIERDGRWKPDIVYAPRPVQTIAESGPKPGPIVRKARKK